MQLNMYQIDAFAEQVFSGNPAAVCPLQEWLPEATMQAIAAENNLAETAFFVPTQEGYQIRWFTPTTEVRLCGHATLASAWVCFHHLGFAGETLVFDSLSGPLTVWRDGELIVMDFPAQPCVPAGLPAGLLAALGLAEQQAHVACLHNEDYVLVLPTAEEVAAISPDFSTLQQVDTRGVIVTAAADDYDFVCRFFGPRVGVNEDAVTGSAYTKLVPYWSKALNKQTMVGKQVSQRGGVVQCQLRGDRVELAGAARQYLQGEITIPG